jgi:hypothetical protein
VDPASTNLFGRFYKWVVGQDENFSTESLALMLHVLSQRDELSAAEFLTWLTRQEWSASTIRQTRIETQRRDEGNQPDLWIYGRDRLVLVEVKVEEELREGQLRSYRRTLDKKTHQLGLDGTLVLLTKYADRPLANEEPDVCWRWFQVADWLEAADIRDSVAAYIRDELLSFLKERLMAMTRVSRDLIGGSASILSILRMAQEAIASPELRPLQPSRTLSGSRGPSVGFSTDDQGIVYWIAIDLTSPDRLYFLADKIDIDAARALGVGEVNSRGQWGQWIHHVPLTSRGFFDLEKTDQIRYVEREIQERVKRARALRRA